MPSRMHQLGLNRQLVQAARDAYLLKKPLAEQSEINFRAVLDDAVEEFLPEIEAALESIRLFASIPAENETRPRPITVETWARLEETGKKYEISKVQLIRCVLELIAKRYGNT